MYWYLYRPRVSGYGRVVYLCPILAEGGLLDPGQLHLVAAPHTRRQPPRVALLVFLSPAAPLSIFPLALSFSLTLLISRLNPADMLASTRWSPDTLRQTECESVEWQPDSSITCKPFKGLARGCVSIGSLQAACVKRTVECHIELAIRVACTKTKASEGKNRPKANLSVPDLQDSGEVIRSVECHIESAIQLDRLPLVGTKTAVGIVTGMTLPKPDVRKDLSVPDWLEEKRKVELEVLRSRYMRVANAQEKTWQKLHKLRNQLVLLCTQVSTEHACTVKTQVEDEVRRRKIVERELECANKTMIDLKEQVAMLSQKLSTSEEKVAELESALDDAESRTLAAWICDKANDVGFAEAWHVLRKLEQADGLPTTREKKFK